MKRFIKYLLLLIAIVICNLYLLDEVYGLIHKHSVSRNKLQYILNTKNENFDIVFLGSSRVANHIDTRLFDSLSNKKTINLGILGGQLNDNFLQLKLLFENNKVSSVFLQLDDNFEHTNPTVMGTASIMPFFRNKIIKEHAKIYLENFNKLYYFPFYKYAINDPKIGFREVVFSLINKKPSIDPSIGYTPKFGNHFSQGGSLPQTIAEENPILNEIKKICDANGVKLILFIAPYSKAIKHKDYVEKLKHKNPELIDLTKGYEESLFFNYGHLNDKGAQLFTKRLYNETLNAF